MTCNNPAWCGIACGCTEVDTLRSRLAEVTAQRDELEAIKHAEERPIRTELRLAKAERDKYKAELDELIDATVLGPLKGKTAHDEIVSLRAKLAEVTAERDYARTHPFEILRAMKFEVDETGIKRQRIMERELVKVTAERDALEKHGLDEYARGVVDGSEINVNILAESKADLEEQRQEIGRLRAERLALRRSLFELIKLCRIDSVGLGDDQRVRDAKELIRCIVQECGLGGACNGKGLPQYPCPLRMP